MSATNIAEPIQLTRDAEAALERIGAARAEIGAVIFGQERVGREDWFGVRSGGLFFRMRLGHEVEGL